MRRPRRWTALLRSRARPRRAPARQTRCLARDDAPAGVLRRGAAPLRTGRGGAHLTRACVGLRAVGHAGRRGRRAHRRRRRGVNGVGSQAGQAAAAGSSERR